MPQSQIGLRVFIASPANLADERHAFQEVLERINRDLAHNENINFMVAGQEFALAGVGRAQALIDQQVRESDYLVVVLWDKFGSSPGGQDNYSSGTEEEFFVGLEGLSESDAPMKNICVLFKGVAPRQLADPGANLQRVLDFKNAIEETRGLLYSTFDTLDEFKDLLRTHFSAWTRDWSGGKEPAKASVNLEHFRSAYGRTAADPASVVNDDDVILELVSQARELARRGRNSTAEKLFAQSIAGPYSREAYTQYVRFVRKRGRLAHAETLANQFIELAQDADDLEGECEGLANLALVSRQEGKHKLCRERLQRALEVVDEWIGSVSPVGGDQFARALSTKAFLLNNMSLTLARIPGGQRDILPLLEQARTVQQRAGDRQGEAFALKNMGAYLYRTGNFERAEECLNTALAQFEDVQYESGQSSTLGALAELYEARGDYELALEKLEQSTHVSRERTPSRLAANHSVMVRVLISLNRVDDARVYVEECVRIGRELGTTESVAAGLQAEAHLALADGDAQAVERAAEEASRRYAEVGNSIGLAASGLMLVRARLLSGDTAMVGQLLDRASDQLIETPHFVLQTEIDRLRMKS